MTRGIPTTYKKIRYRSRLEARWAAFFDSCGWRYVYEPYDLPGWIPDFQLGEAGLLVEVKPFTSWREFEKEAVKKASVYEGEVLFVGTAPRVLLGEERVAYRPCIGWTKDGKIARMDKTRGRYSLVQPRGEFYDLFDLLSGSFCDCRNDWFSHDLDGMTARITGELDRLWGYACNQSQWRGDSL